MIDAGNTAERDIYERDIAKKSHFFSLQSGNLQGVFQTQKGLHITAWLKIKFQEQKRIFVISGSRIMPEMSLDFFDLRNKIKNKLRKENTHNKSKNVR